MTKAYLNRIGTAVPENQVHHIFSGFAGSLLHDPRRLAVFNRLAERSQIEQRWSVLKPRVGEGTSLDDGGFYERGAFPSTGARMLRYEAEAPPLAERAIAALALDRAERAAITHVVVTSCTGFAAPGVDLDIVQRCGLAPSVERTVIGFMGCYAAINGLKIARHIVRSEPKARVLLVSLELCTLHLQETEDLEQILTFLIFGDGCAAALVSAEPTGFALDSFHALLLPDTRGHITWSIGDLGFDMLLSGRVPGELQRGLQSGIDTILAGADPSAIDLWAVHPGGRSVLDAVESGLDLSAEALGPSREVLRRYGNMSSATVLFVLQRMLASSEGDRGCAMAFGPGLVAETMLFSRAA